MEIFGPGFMPAAATGAAAGASAAGPPGALLGGLLAGAGSVLGSGMSAWGAHRANQANISEARRAEALQQANLDRLYREQTASAERKMQFQRDMYGSRYQIMREDLRKAGMNPALAYMQSPGSAPQGAQIQGSTSQGVRPDIRNVIAPFVATGLQAMRTAAELQQIEAQTNQMQAQTSYLRSNTERSDTTSVIQKLNVAGRVGQFLLGLL
jgi:hypothetical protein